MMTKIKSTPPRELMKDIIRAMEEAKEECTRYVTVFCERDACVPEMAGYGALSKYDFRGMKIAGEGVDSRNKKYYIFDTHPKDEGWQRATDKDKWAPKIDGADLWYIGSILGTTKYGMLRYVYVKREA